MSFLFAIRDIIQAWWHIFPPWPPPQISPCCQLTHLIKLTTWRRHKINQQIISSAPSLQTPPPSLDNHNLLYYCLGMKSSSSIATINILNNTWNRHLPWCPPKRGFFEKCLFSLTKRVLPGQAVVVVLFFLNAGTSSGSGYLVGH